ncbi:acyltransferase [Rahnella sp. CFA14(1/10)]|uniref:acyltransferase family protein n=1 Tax=Rahnella sp. CFA14(1/10) TaxID=2511203 RepID=UPI0010202723|nr:acyltransferase [Rahnella sp. CFA14(1/10)]
MERLKGLDGIRGALAIIVALSHAFGHYTGWGSRIYPIHNASFAVDVFFILSGIVLYHAHHNEIESGLMSFTSFAKKRFLRLYPMHILGIILIPISLYVSVGVAYPDWIGDVSFKNMLGDTLLMNSIAVGFNLSSNQPSWSISIEFYIGTLLAFMSCKNKLAPYLIALTSIFLASYFSIKPHDIDQPVSFLVNGGIVRCLFSMSLGVISYKIVLKYHDFFTKSTILTSILGVGGFLLMCAVIKEGNFSMHVYFLMVALLSLSISLIGSVGFKWLSFLDNSFFVMLGKRSFSIYLMHTPLLFIFLNFKGSDNFMNSLLAISIILLTVFISGYTYKYIEKPFFKTRGNRD